MDVEEVNKPDNGIGVQSQPVIQRTLTAEEAALASVAQSENVEWLGLTDADIEDYSLSQDPYPLPKEAKELQDRKVKTFRWCERKIERVNELRNAPRPWKWWIANATTCPELSKHCDTITGGIHMRDQILLVKSYSDAQRVKAYKDELVESQQNALDLSKRRNGRFEDLVFQTGEQAKITDRDHVVWEDKAAGDESFIDTGASED